MPLVRMLAHSGPPRNADPRLWDMMDTEDILAGEYIAATLGLMTLWIFVLGAGLLIGGFMAVSRLV